MSYIGHERQYEVDRSIERERERSKDRERERERERERAVLLITTFVIDA